MREEKLKLAEEIRQMKEQLQQLKERKSVDETAGEPTGEPIETPAEEAYSWYNPAGWFGSSNAEPEQNTAQPETELTKDAQVQVNIPESNMAEKEQIAPEEEKPEQPKSSSWW